MAGVDRARLLGNYVEWLTNRVGRLLSNSFIKDDTFSTWYCAVPSPVLKYVYLEADLGEEFGSRIREKQNNNHHKGATKGRNKSNNQQWHQEQQELCVMDGCLHFCRPLGCQQSKTANGATKGTKQASRTATATIETQKVRTQTIET
jgi:hypothetical protein